MKVSTAILLLSSLYIATALSNTPWTLIQHGLGNSAWSQGLDLLGSQNNLGQFYDSRIFESNTGEVSNIVNSWFQSAGDAAFNYSSELQLAFEGRNFQNSKYALSIDPETGRRSIIWWSVQHLTGDNNGPAGRNITYDKDTDTVTVTSFDGIEEWVLYQQGQPENDPDVVVDDEEDTEVVGENEEATNSPSLTVETYSFRDYLHNFIGYEERDTETYMSDEGLNNAVNNAISAVGDVARLQNIILGEVHTLDTYVDEFEDLWVRVNADVTSDTDSGEIVAVYSCAGGSSCDGFESRLRYWWWNSRLYA